MIERGAAATSIEQVAQRANITKATIYRRFAGKTELSARNVSNGFELPERGGLEWRSLEQMVTNWAEFPSRPNIGRVLRRLYSSAEEYPELLGVYWDLHGRHHWAAGQSTLNQARDQGHLAEDAEIAVIQEILFGTVLYQLVASRQAPDARQIETSLNAVLRQVNIPDWSAASSLMFDAERTQKHCEGARVRFLCRSAAELRRYLKTCSNRGLSRSLRWPGRPDCPTKQRRSRTS